MEKQKQAVKSSTQINMGSNYNVQQKSEHVDFKKQQNQSCSLTTLLAFSLSELWGEPEHLNKAALFSEKYEATTEKCPSLFLLKMDSSTQTALIRT